MSLASPEKVSSLQESVNLLHLIYHRNKNQHRHSKWWKQLAMLRRNLVRLIEEISSGDVTAKTKAPAREEHLSKHILPDCHMYFRALATEGRFCALGLVLLGVLADIVKFIRPASSAILHEESKQDTAENTAIQMLSEEDLGVRVERYEIENSIIPEGLPASSMAVDSERKGDAEILASSARVEHVTDRASIARKHDKNDKKKKRKNAIDDLFGSIS